MNIDYVADLRCEGWRTKPVHAAGGRCSRRLAPARKKKNCALALWSRWTGHR